MRTYTRWEEEGTRLISPRCACGGGEGREGRGETAEEQKGGKGRRDIPMQRAPWHRYCISGTLQSPLPKPADYLPDHGYLPKPPISLSTSSQIYYVPRAPVLNNLDRDVADLITPMPPRIHNFYFNNVYARPFLFCPFFFLLFFLSSFPRTCAEKRWRRFVKFLDEYSKNRDCKLLRRTLNGFSFFFFFLDFLEYRKFALLHRQIRSRQWCEQVLKMEIVLKLIDYGMRNFHFHFSRIFLL